VTGCDFLWAVWGGRSCVPCCVWRVCGGVRAVMYAQSAVVVAARDVARCAVLVCLYAVRECALCGAWLVGERCFG
jgi:hypothetical protein